MKPYHYNSMGGPRGNYGNSEKAHVESKEQQQTH